MMPDELIGVKEHELWKDLQRLYEHYVFHSHLSLKEAQLSYLKVDGLMRDRILPPESEEYGALGES